MVTGWKDSHVRQRSNTRSYTQVFLHHRLWSVRSDLSCDLPHAPLSPSHKDIPEGGAPGSLTCQRAAWWEKQGLDSSPAL